MFDPFTVPIRGVDSFINRNFCWCTTIMSKNNPKLMIFNELTTIS